MLPRVRRFVRLRPSSLWRPDPAETERLLGAAIERVRILGATAIVIDAVEPGPDGRPAAWFPTRAIPVRADVYLRFAWQFADSSGCAGVGAAARGGARHRRRRARGHLPRLRHLHLRGRSPRRGGQRAGGAWRRRLRRAVGGRHGTARHRRGSVAAEGATSTDLLQGRATRTAGSSARVGHGYFPIPAALAWPRTSRSCERRQILGEAGRTIDAMMRAGWLSPQVGAARRPVARGRSSARRPRPHGHRATFPARGRRRSGLEPRRSGGRPARRCRRRPGRVGEHSSPRSSDRCGNSSYSMVPGFTVRIPVRDGVVLDDRRHPPPPRARMARAAARRAAAARVVSARQHPRAVPQRRARTSARCSRRSTRWTIRISR